MISNIFDRSSAWRLGALWEGAAFVGGASAPMLFAQTSQPPGFGPESIAACRPGNLPGPNPQSPIPNPGLKARSDKAAPE
ncbi:hypothetical protein [Lysobacter gummosus]|uniref:hypothetical protein n=1 Tax=Lysobacter gummosus TaxID=262324 RepID=UPI003631FE39